MKRIFLPWLAAAIWVLMAGPLFAQEPTEYLTHISLAPYNPVTGDYELLQYQSFNYSPTGLLDSVTLQEVQNGELVNEALYRYKRNGYNQNDSVFSFYWDPDYLSWQLTTMQKYDYFDSVLVSDMTTYGYASGIYFPVLKISYSYNTYNLEDSVWQFQYNLQSGQWMNMGRTMNTYLNDSVLIQQTLQSWDGNAYVNSQMTDYHKNTFGLDSMVVNFDWNGAQWDFYDRTGYQYQQLNPVVRLNESYQSGNWVNSSLDSNEFDLSNHLIMSDSYTWSGLREWLPATRTTYEYDNLVGIFRPVPLKTLNAKVFPVPAKDFVTISLPPDQTCKAVMKVYNESGALVDQVQFADFGSAGNQFIWHIDKSVPTGVYFYKIVSGNRVSTGKLLISR